MSVEGQELKRILKQKQILKQKSRTPSLLQNILYPNQCVIFLHLLNDKHTAFMEYKEKNGQVNLFHDPYSPLLN